MARLITRRPRRFRWAAVLGAMLATGCASVQGDTQSASKEPANFSSYRNLLISVSSSVPDADDEALSLRRKTVEEFGARSVFPKVAWIAPDKAAPKWDLRLNLRITFKDEASAVLRWLIGNLAGDDTLTVEGIWVENKTGRKLDDFVVKASSPGMGWFKGGIGYDVDECAKRIVEYALDHTPQTESGSAPQAQTQGNL